MMMQDVCKNKKIWFGCIKQSFDQPICFKLLKLSLFSTRAKLHFLFFSIQHLKYILALSVHRMKLLLDSKTKSGNHVILEVKLSS